MKCSLKKTEDLSRKLSEADENLYAEFHVTKKTSKNIHMKNIFKIIFSAFILLGMWSCKKDEHKVIYEGGTTPVLTASATDNIPMTFATQNDPAFNLSWTNPEYKFNTGISSLNVNYNILIDVNDKFNSPDIKTVSVGTDLSKTFTQAELDDILLNQFLLEVNVNHAIYLRVDAFLAGGSKLLSSNTLTINATPYKIPPKVVPPADGKLYIVGGDPQLGAWSNPVPVPAQQFTRVSETLYEITVKLSGGDNTTDKNQFLFLPKNGDWGHKYACSSTGAQPVTGGDFGYDFASNFPGPPTAGTYKISVDFQRGKYTVTKQ